MSEVRLIDANAFADFLRKVSTRQHYEKLLTHKDEYPTVADVIEAVCCDLDGTGLNGLWNAPTVEPENLIKPIAEVKCEITEEEKQRLIELLRKERPTLVKLEPERPQGEWFHYEGTLTCSNCKTEIYDDIMEYLGDDVPKFCPNCGADMRGDENE